MDDKKAMLEVLQAAHRLAEYADEIQEKQFSKKFYSLEQDAKLKDFLGCLTKAELDDMRKNLELKGVSTLKKNELIEILNSQLKYYLPTILSKLTQEDYNLLIKIINNGGSIEYKEKYLQSFLYLREYGILTGALIGKCKHLLIVSDILDEMKDILNMITFRVINDNIV